MTKLEEAAEKWWLENRETCFSLSEAFEAGARWAIDELTKIVQYHGEGGNIENYGILSDKIDALAES